MKVKFFINHSMQNYLVKNIEELKEVDCELKDNTNILNPVLIVKNDDDLLLSNYCYIEKFKRFYYMTVTVGIGGKMFMTCGVDVLMTYKKIILNSHGTVVKINELSSFIDDSLPIDPYKVTLREVLFPNQFFLEGQTNYILISR